MLEDYRPYVISVSVLVAPMQIGETLPHPSARGSTPMGGGAATPVWRERLTAFSSMAKSVMPSAGGPTGVGQRGRSGPRSEACASRGSLQDDNPNRASALGHGSCNSVAMPLQQHIGIGAVQPETAKMQLRQKIW
jgi:hypothetical protein